MSTYSTAKVADAVGVHRDTLLRWLRQKKISEPARNAYGWRVFSQNDLREIKRFAHTLKSGKETSKEPADEKTLSLSSLDWNFDGAATDYLTHSIHPYPAKFIPQIPNALIQELSSVGDTVLDVFCGSGTTLVEAKLLKRHSIGIDANPLACLISKVKTRGLSSDECDVLTTLACRAEQAAAGMTASENDLFGVSSFKSVYPRPEGDYLEFWFDSFVIEELAEIRGWCYEIDAIKPRELALVAFSSVIVMVSRQDSDTRYVRREKNLSRGAAFTRFSRKLRKMIEVAREARDIFEPRFESRVICANSIEEQDVGEVDLIVTSPPYPNAYSYHLYHQHRMVWLEFNHLEFKKQEIGSHRKYSAKGKGAATVNTFREEIKQILHWVSKCLKPKKYASFVIGNSRVKGRQVNNATLIAEEALDVGLIEVARIARKLQLTKKTFNPKIGNIKEEKILILQKEKDD